MANTVPSFIYKIYCTTTKQYVRGPGYRGKSTWYKKPAAMDALRLLKNRKKTSEPLTYVVHAFEILRTPMVINTSTEHI